MRGQHEPVREQKPPDRVAAAAKGEHQSDPARGQPRGPPRHPDPGLLPVAAGQDIEHAANATPATVRPAATQGAIRRSRIGQSSPVRAFCNNRGGAWHRRVLAPAQLRCSRRCAQAAVGIGSSCPASSRKDTMGSSPNGPAVPTSNAMAAAACRIGSPLHATAAAPLWRALSDEGALWLLTPPPRKGGR